MSYLSLVVRTTQSPADLVPQIRHVVESFDRALPVSQVLTMDEAVDRATAQPHFEMWLLTSFVRLP